jgi:hypothetical protein
MPRPKFLIFLIILLLYSQEELVQLNNVIKEPTQTRVSTNAWIIPWLFCPSHIVVQCPLTLLLYYLKQCYSDEHWTKRDWERCNGVYFAVSHWCSLRILHRKASSPPPPPQKGTIQWIRNPDHKKKYFNFIFKIITLRIQNFSLKTCKKGTNCKTYK